MRLTRKENAGLLVDRPSFSDAVSRCCSRPKMEDYLFTRPKANPDVCFGTTLWLVQGISGVTILCGIAYSSFRGTRFQGISSVESCPESSKISGLCAI